MVVEDRDKEPQIPIQVSLSEAPEPLPSAPALAPGTLLAGRYKILKFIARGGMGDVFEAEDLELGVRVALKTLRAGVAAGGKAVERFKREIALARKVTHPNVCRIFDAGFHRPGESEGGTDLPVTFLTMELLEGETLAERLERSGRLTPAEALAVVRQVSAALAAAHAAGVVHRDLKCGNVMLVPGPDGERAVVTDFGLARALATGDSQSPTLTATGTIFGTPAYMAPEQVQGGEITPATDLYALGVILFELVTGELPFKADSAITAAVMRLTEPPPSPRSLTPELSARWERTILKCLEKEPSRRFKSAGEVLDALEGRVPVRRKLPWGRIALAAGVVILLAAAAAGVIVALRRPPRAAPPQAPSGPAVLPAKSRKAVAVLWFRNLAGRPGSAWLSTALAEMVGTELAAGGALRAIPGENVARMRAELDLPDEPTLAGDTLRRVRENLGADYVVLGSYTALGPESGKQLRLDLFVQDAATGETTTAITGSGTEDRLFDMVSSVGNQLREKLGTSAATPEEASQVQAASPADPRAAELYAQGLEELRRFEPVKARDTLTKAAALEPSQPMIHLALARTWTDLGYDPRAEEEAKKAFDLSRGLSRENRLFVEAKYRLTAQQWDKAEELYRSLFTFYPDNLEYGLDLAAAQIDGGRTKEALPTLAALRALPPPAGRDPRIDLTEAYAARALSDFDRILVLARKTSEDARRLGMWSLVARAKRYEGWALRRMGRMDEAMAACEEARAVSHRLGDKMGEALAVHTMANILHAQGKLSEAVEKYQIACATFKEYGFKKGMSWSLNDMADVSYSRGDLAEARRSFEQVLAIGKEIDDKDGLSTVTGNLASLLVIQGDLAKADEYCRECLALCDQLGHREMKVAALSAAGEIRLIGGDLAGALAADQESVALGEQIGAGTELPYAREALGWTLLELGKPSEAESQARQAAAALEKEKASCMQVGAIRLLAQALLDQKKLDQARAEEEKAGALGTGCEAVLDRISTAAVSARVLAAGGRAAEAMRQLEAALSEAGKCGDVRDGFAIRLALGRIQIASGQAAQGRALLAALEKDARDKGFLLLARKASGAAGKS